ncbi:hypothetical protein PBAC_23670 [Pedobacter glucosidilyticus]|uniref:MetA-pathway of phenol degradation n=1 Tax=Pedobacter aquae TaxID=2605747 RepID=A0A5C0VE90_9SPHI|nr:MULTISPECIES: hypothetical protein [Pedobacter]KHJ37405.1 hypothetical protein PBAC_23670 [Pedobacter glucosidilyticus]QEK50998.1 hypothetical protein FYC62_04400 [Pedobacter aquae]
MIKFYATLILTLFSYTVFAQNLNGPRIQAMANAGVAMQDIWTLKNNAAGITSLENTAFAIAYENRFSVKELSTKSAAIVIPLKRYSLGASFQSYGSPVYQELKSGLSFAKAFGENFSTALTLNYHQLSIQNYGNTNTFSFQVGFQYQVFKNFWIAAHAANPNKSQYTETESNTLPALYQIGASYTFTDKLLVTSEIEQVVDGKLDFKTGLEYKIAPFLALRGGTSVNTFQQFGGFGIIHQKINLDFAISSHPILGYSPQIALGYAF